MLKILIVDDQKPVRDGLKQAVDWNRLGYEVAGDVNCAKAALDFIQSHTVDVMLTDIIMPEMNGLALINELNRNLNIKTIILSGYNEFEYAREAIRLGAYDYLTKPVIFSELEKILINIKETIYNERKNKEDAFALTQSAREAFLNKLVKGYFNDVDEAIARINKLDLGLEPELYYTIVNMRIMYLNEDALNNRDEQRLVIEIGNALRKFRVLQIFESDARDICILIGSANKEISVMEEINGIKEQIQNDPGYILHIGLGETKKGLLDINASYDEANLAIDSCITIPGSYIQEYKQIKNQNYTQLSEKTRSEIINSLYSNDEKKLKELMGHIIGGFHDFSIYNVCIEFILIILKFINDSCETQNMADQINFNPKDIYKYEDVNGICGFMESIIDKAVNILKSKKENSSGFIIDSIKKYMEQHYAEDISLKKMADMYHLHFAHLSRLFKEKTNINFIDYLTNIRIEKSKDLLKDSSLKIYDVSDMVGYDSPKYFSKTFKEYTGITPAEFREGL